MIYIFVFGEEDGAEAFVRTKLKSPKSQGGISPNDEQGSGRLGLGTGPASPPENHAPSAFGPWPPSPPSLDEGCTLLGASPPTAWAPSLPRTSKPQREILNVSSGETDSCRPHAPGCLALPELTPASGTALSQSLLGKPDSPLPLSHSVSCKTLGPGACFL